MPDQDIQPSPDPEFIDCPRCGQPVLKDNLSRQWNGWGQVCWCDACGSFEADCHAFDEPAPAPKSGLEVLIAPTQRILGSVERLSPDLAEIPARAFASALEALIDDLVSNLVPLMAAEETVLCRTLDHGLADAIREDHREMRRSIERLTMLSENLERRARRPPNRGPMRRALHEMGNTLGGLGVHQQAALRHLNKTLPIEEHVRLAADLETAATDAREQTMLIVRPAIPATAAHVLRRRPDLDAAYALSLAEIERRSQQRH